MEVFFFNTEGGELSVNIKVYLIPPNIFVWNYWSELKLNRIN